MSLLFELRVTIYYLLHLSITYFHNAKCSLPDFAHREEDKRQRPLREALYKRVMKEILSDDKQ